FHLLSSAPDDGEETALGARGLTGPAYGGHVFWDTEVYVLPALAALRPAAARALLDYRVRRLPAARAAALAALAQPVPGRIAGVQATLEAADEELAPLLVSALARMGRADATAALVDALTGGHVHSRRAAAAALAALGPSAHAELERAAAEDPDPEVRRVSAEALGR
ncbi:MAG TPA: HEAT repeat domain-containing protein, partial [Aggregicoccus sp.]|nr:HEAT repeat domain-containing protein [Aggregicoccus sp.]